ncbi:MAG: collagen binding domain-containing protein [Longimicrobiales bacterium]
MEGDGLAGITANLTGPSQASTVSGADGSFTFTNLVAGQYTVAIVGIPAEFQFAQTTNAVTVVSGQAASAVFVGEHVRTASITGMVLVDGVGLEGATLTLSGTETAQVSSDGSGAFLFNDLRAGDYTVTLSGLAADLTFPVLARTVTVAIGGTEGIEFSGIQEKPPVVTIAFLENDDGFRIGPNVIKDNLIVLVDLDEGTQSVTKVTLFVDGDNVGEQTLPAPSGPAAGAGMDTQRLRFEVNTVEFDPDSGGPRFTNGPHVLRVSAETEQSGPGAAETTLGVTFINTDLIGGINLLSGAGGIVMGGVRWWGGGDLFFEIVPVIYDVTRTISAIDVIAIGEASANGGPSLDLGSGLGAAHRVTGPPFLFSATQADNHGFVEDDPTRGGHTIRVVGVLDGNGADITPDFLPGRADPLTGLHVDFVGPQINPGGRITVGGAFIVGGEWFSTGAFALSPPAFEAGVGGVTSRISITVGGNVVATDVSSIDELAERGLSYRGTLASLEDLLGNPGPATNVGLSGLFGVDRTPVNITAVIPVTTVILNPDDDAGDGIADNRPAFTANDPVLGDGTSGSGYATGTAIGVDALGIPIDLSSQIQPNAGGLNTLSPTILPTSTYSFDFTVTDRAQPANSATSTVSFILDRTDPITNMGPSVPAGTVFNSSSSLTFTVEGNAMDANGISNLQLVVRDADSGGIPGICELVDSPVTRGTGPGQVLENTFDVTAMSSGFSVNVTVQNAGGVATVQTLCYWIEALDSATDVNGAPEPNGSFAVARQVITWN